MKAFLLAAGLGTRLKPITNEIPKCLVPINGKPLLEWWIELLERHNINEVLINLHHFPDKVKIF
jgi:mannose-1-phosphate guanylyltransferase